MARIKFPEEMIPVCSVCDRKMAKFRFNRTPHSDWGRPSWIAETSQWKCRNSEHKEIGTLDITFAMD